MEYWVSLSGQESWPCSSAIPPSLPFEVTRTERERSVMVLTEFGDFVSELVSGNQVVKGVSPVSRGFHPGCLR